VCEEGEKVVVFSQWERMTRLVAKELRKKGIGFEYLHGGVPSEKRKDMVDNFTNNAESRVFLSTDAGSTGLNLQVAATIINIDLPWNPAVLEQRIGRIYRLGQQSNIQVINLVAPHSIEETMVGKLRFKTSMFEGVLDNGEDSIFADDNKFGKIMETVSSFVSEEDKGTPDKNEEDANTTTEAVVTAEEKEEAAKGNNTTPEDGYTAEGMPYTAEDLPDGNTTDDRQTAMDKSFDNEPYTKSHKMAQPKELVEQGVSFLSGLAETLKSPEATTALVDSITEKDEKTGETSIKIPVESKETVKNLLNLIGKLFAK
ncbi:C-terminal helicase domain-containing protein, partial [Prevotella pectinovora]